MERYIPLVYPIKKKTLIASFAGVFIFESILALWTGLPYDMKVWFQTGMWMNQGINIYLPPDHLGYPPLWAFWCNAAYNIYSYLPSLEIWNFVIKLPMIIAHLALTFLAAKFVAERFDQKTGRRVFFFVLTWSFFIFISAAWGQINILSTLLTFLAFYAVVRDRIVESALLLGVAVTLKIYPLIVLPAFLIHIFKKFSAKHAVKFALITCVIPVFLTLTVFLAYGWDILYFLQTIFYWTPIFESNPVLILRGCMNIWSFVALLNVNMADLWILRMIWIPTLLVGVFYWLRKPKLNESNLNLSIISLYLLFMMTYSWVGEQTLIDPLPFLLLQILAYNPKKISLYMLSGIQILVYLFSAVNWGGFIFQPWAEQFYPSLLPVLQLSDPTISPASLAIRGILGLTISIVLGAFLFLLMKQASQKAKASTMVSESLWK